MFYIEVKRKCVILDCKNVDLQNYVQKLHDCRQRDVSENIIFMLCG